MAHDFDLFGNPVVLVDEKLGRPSHVPTQENIIFVMVLLAAGYPNKQIAETLGLTVPTLRKHYFHLLRNRSVMADRIRTKLRASQIQAALSGNASAMNGALRMLESLNAEKANHALAERAKAREPKARKLGKKEEKAIAAQSVVGKFAPPAAPKLVVDNR